MPDRFPVLGFTPVIKIIGCTIGEIFNRLYTVLTEGGVTFLVRCLREGSEGSLDFGSFFPRCLSSLIMAASNRSS
jgi:hypothetical protein